MESHLEKCKACRQAMDGLDGSRGEVDAEPSLRPAEPCSPPEIKGYDLLERIDRGGRNLVFRARDLVARRSVAIKLIPPDDRRTVPDRERWQREAETIGAIQHSHVVPLYHVGETAGWLYLVLAYIEGGTLKDRLVQPLPAKPAARIAETMARALQAVHEHGLRHLDVKPSNILLDDSYGTDLDMLIPKLADFDIARNAADLTMELPAGQGTPSYMAPEQVVGNRDLIGEWTDIYALGATLYEMLSGTPPFRAPSPKETMELVCIREAVPLREVQPGVPHDLETIVMKCLQKEPAKRYSSAFELAEDLKRFLAGEAIRARRMGPLEHTWRWCLRRPTLAVSLAALAVVTFVVMLSITALYSRAESSLRETEELLRESARNLESLALLNQNRARLYSEQWRQGLQLVLNEARALHRRRPDLTELRVSLVHVLTQMADHDKRHGATEQALLLLDEAITIARPDDRYALVLPEVQVVLARLFDLKADCEAWTEHWPEAIEASRQACALIEARFHKPGANRADHLIMVGFRMRLARRLSQAGEIEEARRLAVADRPFLECRLKESPDNLDAIDAWANSLDASDDGSVNQAFELACQSIKHSPNDPRLLHFIASRCYFDAERAHSADERRACFARLEALIRPYSDRITFQALLDPDDFYALRDGTFVWQLLAIALKEQGRLREAEDAIRICLRIAAQSQKVDRYFLFSEKFYPHVLCTLASTRLALNATVELVTTEMKTKFNTIASLSKSPNIWRPRYVLALARLSMDARVHNLSQKTPEILRLAVKELESLNDPTIDRVEKNKAATELWIQIGKHHWNDPDHNIARNAFVNAVEAARATGDVKLHDDRLRRLQRFCNSIGDFAEAFSLMRQRERLSIDDPERRKTLQTAYGNLAKDVRASADNLPEPLRRLEHACHEAARKLTRPEPMQSTSSYMTQFNNSK